MTQRLAADYLAMSPMIFGDPPSFEEILAGIAELEKFLNAECKDVPSAGPGRR